MKFKTKDLIELNERYGSKDINILKSRRSWIVLWSNQEFGIVSFEAKRWEGKVVIEKVNALGGRRKIRGGQEIINLQALATGLILLNELQEMEGINNLKIEDSIRKLSVGFEAEIKGNETFYNYKRKGEVYESK